MNKKKKIYLDYAATSPIKKEALVAMQPYMQEKFGNPSSIHSFGQETRHAIDEAREKAAKFLNCAPSEIIFTSGGTEADNLAIIGAVNNYRGKNKPHIITSQIEHHAILHTCQWLEKRKEAVVTYIPVDKNGLVEIKDIERAIRLNTAVISIMYVNNEIGTVQPIREIGKMIEKIKKEGDCPRTGTVPNNSLIFHTDAVQAIEYQNCDVKYLHIDMLSLSGHKFGAPKGIGLLYIRKGIKLDPIIHGGAQEFGWRAGTENVAGIVGFGKAIQLLSQERKTQSASWRTKRKTKELRDYFINNIEKNISSAILNGDREKRNPNNINFSFKGIESESILLLLDEAGIAASSGSACASGSLEPSHVLLAIGQSHQDVQGSVRFTIGEETTKEEIDYTLKVLIDIVKKLRERSPFPK